MGNPKNFGGQFNLKRYNLLKLLFLNASRVYRFIFLYKSDFVQVGGGKLPMNKWICLVLSLAVIVLSGCGSVNNKSWEIYDTEYRNHHFFFESGNPLVVLPAVISFIPAYILAAPAPLFGADYEHVGSLMMWGPCSPFILFGHEPFVKDKEEVAAARQEELLGGPPDYGDEWDKERNWQEDRELEKEWRP